MFENVVELEEIILNGLVTCTHISVSKATLMLYFFSSSKWLVSTMKSKVFFTIMKFAFFNSIEGLTGSKGAC